MLPEATSVWSWWWSASNKADETSRNILTTFVLLFFIFWFIFYVRKQNKGKPPPLPPGPRGLPLVGYLPFLDPNLHHGFIKLANLYGPIFRIRLGIKECIVVSSPALVKEVVRDQDAVFANRVPLIAAQSLMFGAMDFGFSNYGVEWRKMRKIFAVEMLSNARLDASYYLRIQHVNKMMNLTYEKAGQLVSIGDLAFSTLVGSVMSMVWGDTLKGDEEFVINSEFRTVINEQQELLGAPNISDFFPFLARFDLQGIERRMRIISKRNEEILDKAINHHNGESIQRKDFLGHLMQHTKCEDRASSLTLPQVKAMLLDVVTGGTDTTVAVVEWAMAAILQHPQVLGKVQEELTEIVGLNKTVEEVHLPELKYLNAVIKETLRLHPPIPLLVPHCPSEPSTIGGYSIPQGARVFLNIYSIQRDPHNWEDPLLFKPERFLSGSAAEKMDYLGNHFKYLPFGSGRRMCPGIPLAERTSMLVLASLLHAFQWKLPNGTVEVDFSEKFGIVVKKAKPLFAVPSPRLSNLDLYSYDK